MNGLRIALVASNRFPIAQPFAGGLEAHVWHLARGLVDAGHEVTLFAGPGSDAELGCTQLAVRTIRLSEAAASDASSPGATFMADHHAYLHLMLDLAHAGRDGFDVVHNHSLHYLPIVQAPTLSMPMLCTLHTPPTSWLESAITASHGEGVAFAAVSRHTAQAWKPLVPKAEVVPNGIDVDLWRPGPGGPSLVWFGRLTPEKGPHLAVEAARSSGFPLVLAGPCSDPDYFRAEIEPHLDDRIRYAGHLDQAELAALVGSSAAALVTPAWDEPYGLVVAEALACGTPVVAFARGGIPEIVDDTCALLVPADDTRAMARAIPIAAGLPRSAARSRAVDVCSARVMIDRYLSLYHRMLDNQRATA
jgi:glycosyltransferase involved in cell wall biosynthesis